MSAINGNAEAELLSLNFSPTELARVGKVPEFVAAINEFSQRGGHFAPCTAGAEMVPDENALKFEKSGNYSNFKTLSHELGHYFGVNSRNSVSDFYSAKEYAAAMAKGEAEAIYNEYKMLAAEAAATGSLHQPPEMSFDSETPGGQYNVVKFALYISNAIQIV